MMMEPVFIGGCGRSGTTYLGSQFGTLPGACVTPESGFVEHLLRAAESGSFDARALKRAVAADDRFRIWPADHAALIAAVPDDSPDPGDFMAKLIGAYAAARGMTGSPSYWVDHTPASIRRTVLLRRHFPSARFVHLVRDGRAVASSVMRCDWGPNDVLEAAEWWLWHLAFGFAAELEHGPDVVVRTSFEAAIADGPGVVATLAERFGWSGTADGQDSVGLDLPEYTKDQHRLVGGGADGSRAEAWCDELSQVEVEDFEARAGAVLELLGYQLIAGPATGRDIPAGRKARYLLFRSWRKLLNRLRKRRRVRQALAGSG